MFEKSALIDTLYVERPADLDLRLHSSAKPMLLSLHKDRNTFSFHETGARRSYYSFSKEHIVFESFHSQTVAFSVRDGHDLWRFRCICATNKNTLDFLYPYLSGSTVRTPAVNLMNYYIFRLRFSFVRLASYVIGFLLFQNVVGLNDISRVQLYISMGPTRNPIVRNYEDLRSPSYYIAGVKQGDPYEKFFCITPRAALDKPRFVFRTSKIRVRKSTEEVVLTVSGFENWYYIIYVNRRAGVVDLISRLKHSTRCPIEALYAPSDVLAHINSQKRMRGE